MKKIEFRGKSLFTEKKEWHFGNLLIMTANDNTKHYYIADGSWSTTKGSDWVKKIRIDPETIGQNTGYLDINDKEIFEGDIVRYKNDIEEGEGEVVSVFDNSTTVIFWYEQSTTKPTFFTELMYLGCKEELTVIDNIYDHDLQIT